MVNVETQQDNVHSLLWWMKHLFDLRKRHQAFGRGSLEMLTPDNPKTLAFVRRWQDENILVVANLSRFVQCMRVDMSAFRGVTPVELMGRTPFPVIGETPYFLTLGPHAFHWFLLRRSRPLWKARSNRRCSRSADRWAGPASFAASPASCWRKRCPITYAPGRGFRADCARSPGPRSARSFPSARTPTPRASPSSRSITTRASRSSISCRLLSPRPPETKQIRPPRPDPSSPACGCARARRKRIHHGCPLRSQRGTRFRRYVARTPGTRWTL